MNIPPTSPATNPQEKARVGDDEAQKVTPDSQTVARDDDKALPKKKPGENKQTKVSDSIRKWSVLITSCGSAVSGLFSFINTSLLDKQNDLIDKFSTYLSKASVFSTGVYGAWENCTSKNTFGAIGYLSDLVVSALASSKRLYLLRAIGSGLDQIPSMLKDFAAKFPSLVDDKFLKFKDHGPVGGLVDSARKTLFASREILKEIAADIKRNYDKDGITGIVKPFFDVKKAERSHLLSSIGLVFCGLTAIFIRNCDIVIGSLRDAFGLYADYAISCKGASKGRDGKPTGAGNKTYTVSGLSDLFGSFTDFIARFFPDSGLHFVALGASRLAAKDLAFAQTEDNAETYMAQAA